MSTAETVLDAAVVTREPVSPGQCQGTEDVSSLVDRGVSRSMYKNTTSGKGWWFREKAEMVRILDEMFIRDICRYPSPMGITDRGRTSSRLQTRLAAPGIEYSKIATGPIAEPKTKLLSRIGSDPII